MIRRHNSGNGFTITELLVSMFVLFVLLGLLIPVLASVRRSGLMTSSMSNMRQIGNFMKLYAGDNRDQVVPSEFNYDPFEPDNPDCTIPSYRGKVRSVVMNQPRIGMEYHGTWTDILWTVFEMGVYPQAAAPRPQGIGHDYKFDSPDFVLYRFWSQGDIVNPLRSAALNSRNVVPGDRYKPFGSGAREQGLPGFFAANNFFNANCERETFNNVNSPNGWFTFAQIRMPEQSMYLVDSFAGEVIEDDPDAFLMNIPGNSGGIGGPGGPGQPGPDDEPPGEVDFRYSDLCLMLFLDGHVVPQGRWDEICDLEGPGSRGIRIRELTTRANPCPTAP